MYFVKYINGWYRVYDATVNQLWSDVYASVSEAHEAIRERLADLR